MIRWEFHLKWYYCNICIVNITKLILSMKSYYISSYYRLIVHIFKDTVIIPMQWRLFEAWGTCISDAFILYLFFKFAFQGPPGPPGPPGASGHPGSPVSMATVVLPLHACSISQGNTDLAIIQPHQHAEFHWSREVTTKKLSFLQRCLIPPHEQNISN